MLWNILHFFLRKAVLLRSFIILRFIGISCKSWCNPFVWGRNWGVRCSGVKSRPADRFRHRRFVVASSSQQLRLLTSLCIIEWLLFYYKSNALNIYDKYVSKVKSKNCFIIVYHLRSPLSIVLLHDKLSYIHTKKFNLKS